MICIHLLYFANITCKNARNAHGGHVYIHCSIYTSFQVPT